ncbi:MAG: BadF/BadG/BcrA/BcrD ATPase family protein [Candidatus Kapaibacteriales bacterium]
MQLDNQNTLIGIDGGGTHTRGIIFKEGKIAATSRAGTTRIGAVGVGESCERTLNMILDLCEQSDTDYSEIDAVVVGLAGVWLPDEKKRSAALLRTLARGHDFKFSNLMVTSDAEIALEGAFQGDEGIITIVGTGSIGLGNPKGGELVRCGGWGIELDDEGSGAWIGREGLTGVVRGLDGRGKPTKLAELIEEMIPSIDLKVPRTIVKAYADAAFKYPMLTPLVMKCALEGDEICLDIIERSAIHLAELPATLTKQFKSKKTKVALMGGIIDNDTMLAGMLKEEIAKNNELELVEAKGNALQGALLIGDRMIAEEIENS